MADSRISCLHYWDQCDVLSIEATIALWCNVEPSLLNTLNFSTSCMDVKKTLILRALIQNRLEYELSADAWSNASIEEHIRKEQILIKKDSLRLWFEQMQQNERPAFLFEESRNPAIPDVGVIAEMNADTAIAIMAILLSNHGASKYKINDRPNASKIAEDIHKLALERFGPDNSQFKSFSKRISRALNIYEEEINDFNF